MRDFVLNAPVLWWHLLAVCLVLQQVLPAWVRAIVRRERAAELVRTQAEAQQVRQELALARLARAQGGASVSQR